MVKAALETHSSYHNSATSFHPFLLQAAPATSPSSRPLLPPLYPFPSSHLCAPSHTPAVPCHPRSNNPPSSSRLSHLLLAPCAHRAVQQNRRVSPHHGTDAHPAPPLQQLPHSFFPNAAIPGCHRLRVDLVGLFVQEDGAELLSTRGFHCGLVLETVGGSHRCGGVQKLLFGGMGGMNWGVLHR